MNWYTIIKFAIAENLAEKLRNIGVEENVIQQLDSLPNEQMGKAISTLMKNPQKTFEQVQQEVQPQQEQQYDPQLVAVAQQFGFDPEQLLHILDYADPTDHGEYHGWILKQMKNGAIRLPEDAYDVSSILQRFHDLKNTHPDFPYSKDIHQYPTIHVLKDTLDEVIGGSKSQNYLQVNPKQLDGVELYRQTENYNVYRVTEAESLALMGKGTDWCTREDYPNCMAESYIDGHGEIFVITSKDGKLVAQYTPDYDQFMNIEDRPIDPRDDIGDEIIEAIEPSEEKMAQEPEIAYDYANKFLDGAYPKGEKYIASSPSLALTYAKFVLHDRFPEAEETIAQKPKIAMDYAREIIGGRFPEAEDEFAKDSYLAFDYADGVLNDRFPKGEDKIKQHPSAAIIYAKDHIGGRWPEAEPYIKQDPRAMVNYASEVIGGRWSEMESEIKQNPVQAALYARDVIKDEWPEAEPYIKQSEYASYIYANAVLGEDHPRFNEFESLSPQLDERRKRQVQSHIVNHLNWYKRIKFAISDNLADKLRTVGVDENVIQQLDSLPNEQMGKAISTLMKNPQMTFEQVQQEVQPQEQQSQYDSQLLSTAQELGLHPDYVSGMLASSDPTDHGEYHRWILKQMRQGTIRLPEDGSDVRNTLENFHQAKNNPNFQYSKDIHQYPTIQQLDEALEETVGGSKKQNYLQVDPKQLDGVELYNQNENYTVYKVTNSESLALMGQGTKWCTRADYPDCAAEDYLRDNDSIFVVTDNKGKLVAQYTPDYRQVMDANDKEINADELSKEMIEVMEPSEEKMAEDPAKALDFTLEFLQDRYPKAEKYIKQYPQASLIYAMYNVKGRWPEGEETIMQDPQAAYNYAKQVLKDRFPEAEDVIKKQPDVAIRYAKHVIGGRWPEVEPFIKNDPSEAVSYAKEVIDGRWPEGEEVIKQHPVDAYRYARNVVKSRWPEGEEAIKQSPKLAASYAKDVLQDRWPEAEHIIKRNRYALSIYKDIFNSDDPKRKEFETGLVMDEERA